jgi:hypothetical protein
MKSPFFNFSDFPRVIEKLQLFHILRAWERAWGSVVSLRERTRESLLENGKVDETESRPFAERKATIGGKFEPL